MHRAIKEFDDIHILNYTCVNIRWGRGQETYGECPYLSSEMAFAYVTGQYELVNKVCNSQNLHFFLYCRFTRWKRQETSRGVRYLQMVSRREMNSISFNSLLD